jgi:dolichyl-phosphate-mannose-protein mannosyltransferase
MFLTLKASGCRTFTAAMGAGLIIFGNSRIARNVESFH